MLVKMLDSICKFVNKRLKLRKLYCSLEGYRYMRLHNYINQAIFNVYREKGNSKSQLDVLMEVRRLYNLIEDSVGLDFDKDTRIEKLCNTDESSAHSDAASAE